MAVKLDPARDDLEVMADINTTPLIDVMLVLLIMLIITIPLQTQAVNIGLPGDQPAPVTLPTILRLAILPDGRVQLDGNEIADLATLEARMQALARDPALPQVQILPDRTVKYGYVARVMAAAQRAGLTRVGIVGNEVYAQ